jgi:hypothetical protein
MSGLDAATLMGLMAADPETRQLQVQRLLMERMGASAARTGEAPGPEPEPDAGPSLRRVIREATRLSEETDRLARLLADVGLALGACPRCLGSQPDCSRCAGSGGPGTSTPDVDRFERVIAPAAQRLVADTADHRFPMEEQVT